MQMHVWGATTTISSETQNLYMSSGEYLQYTQAHNNLGDMFYTEIYHTELREAVFLL